MIFMNHAVRQRIFRKGALFVISDTGVHMTVEYKGHSGLRIYRSRETDDYPPHWHTEMEIIMPSKSSYTVSAADQLITAQPGEIVIIPPGELHSLSAPAAGSRLIIAADLQFLDNIPGITYVTSVLSVTHIRPPEGPDDKTHAALSDLLRQIDAEYSSDSPLCDAACFALLAQFIVILGRSVLSGVKSPGMENSSKKSGYHIERCLKVCNYINAHCTEAIAVEDLAAIAGFSKSHFTRLFKQYMNISPHDYLIQRRVMYAAQLLATPGCSIMQASVKAGFNDLYTFNRCFKELKKCTPSEFIALNRAAAKADMRS